MAGKKIFLLTTDDDIVEILNVLTLCCDDRPFVVPVLTEPISWATKLTTDEVAEILDKGVDVSKFVAENHDPHGIIQSKLSNPPFL